MTENNVPENLSPFYPPGAEESPVTDAVATPESGAPAVASDVPREQPPVAPQSSLLQPSRLTLESLETPFRRPQPVPIHWAVGWADLMMTMFVLFLVMYLYPSVKEAQTQRTAQEQQGQQGGAAGRGEGRQGEMGKGDTGKGQAGQGGVGQGSAEAPKSGAGTTAGQAELSAIQAAKLFDLTKLTKEDEEFAKIAEIGLNPDHTVRIVLAADLLFPSGKADLRLIAKENIKKIADLLAEIPHKINVIGHTDDQPIRGGAFASNWELSVMRATSVARFLIEEMGVSASRVTVSGRSFYQPQAGNATPADRAKNRRVEIIVSLDPPPALPLINANPSSPKQGGQ